MTLNNFILLQNLYKEKNIQSNSEF